jgi:hypothetical protein
MKTLRQLIRLCGLLVALYLVKPASASYLYDVTGGLIRTGEEAQFIVPDILTSITTVESFLTTSSSSGEVTGVTLDPIASGSCPSGLLGPCIEFSLNFGSREEPFGAFPVFTSVGMFLVAIRVRR